MALRANFKCRLCPFETRYIRALGTHYIQIHDDFKPFQCSFCSKCFKTKANCDRHIRIHTGRAKKIKMAMKTKKSYSNLSYFKVRSLSHARFVTWLTIRSKA